MANAKMNHDFRILAAETAKEAFELYFEPIRTIWAWLSRHEAARIRLEEQQSMLEAQLAEVRSRQEALLAELRSEQARTLYEFGKVIAMNSRLEGMLSEQAHRMTVQHQETIVITQSQYAELRKSIEELKHTEIAQHRMRLLRSRMHAVDETLEDEEAVQFGHPAPELRMVARTSLTPRERTFLVSSLRRNFKLEEHLILHDVSMLHEAVSYDLATTHAASFSFIGGLLRALTERLAIFGW
jgi:hypothetical protein